MGEERATATAQLAQLGAVVKDEADAFDLIVTPLAKIVTQFKAVAKADKFELDGSLKNNTSLHLNPHLGNAGRAFAKEVSQLPCAIQCIVVFTAAWLTNRRLHRTT